MSRDSIRLLLIALHVLCYCQPCHCTYPTPSRTSCQGDFPCLALYRGQQNVTWQQAYDMCAAQKMSLLPIHNRTVQDAVDLLIGREFQVLDLGGVWTAGRQIRDSKFRTKDQDIFQGVVEIDEGENCVKGQLSRLITSFVRITTDNCGDSNSIIFTVCQRPRGTTDCLNGYISGDFCYQYLGVEGNWYESKDICLRVGSDLTDSDILGNTGLLSYLHDSIATYPDYYDFWVGAIRYQWTWDFPGNETMLYNNWDLDSDVLDQTDYCLYVDPTTNRWRPGNCSTKLAYFLCINTTTVPLEEEDEDDNEDNELSPLYYTVPVIVVLAIVIIAIAASLAKAQRRVRKLKKKQDKAPEANQHNDFDNPEYQTHIIASNPDPSPATNPDYPSPDIPASDPDTLATEVSRSDPQYMSLYMTGQPDSNATHSNGLATQPNGPATQPSSPATQPTGGEYEMAQHVAGNNATCSEHL